MKVCSKCDKELEVSLFYSNLRYKDTLDCYCKNCRIKSNSPREKFNITAEELDPALLKLYKAQAGLCGVCRSKVSSYNVDHDADTKEPVGLLCSKCYKFSKLLYNAARYYKLTRPHKFALLAK